MEIVIGMIEKDQQPGARRKNCLGQCRANRAARTRQQDSFASVGPTQPNNIGVEERPVEKFSPTEIVWFSAHGQVSAAL
jgi:hypothetical protein